MIWVVIIIIGIAVIFVFRNINSDNKDKKNLQGQSLQSIFPELFELLNNRIFNGEGKVNQIEKLTYSLYKEGDNQIIIFMYGSGNLIIEWRYKYFHKEVVHRKTFNNALGSSIQEQINFADKLINEMEVVIQRHKQRVSMNA